MHNNTNYQCKICWNKALTFGVGSIQPLCSPNTCKYVFNPNITTFQSNCAEGLHFSAFIILGTHMCIMPHATQSSLFRPGGPNVKCIFTYKYNILVRLKNVAQYKSTYKWQKNGYMKTKQNKYSNSTSSNIYNYTIGDL